MCVLACWHVFWSRPAMSHGTLYLSSPSLFLPSSSNPLFLHSSHDPPHSHVPCEHPHRHPTRQEEVCSTLLLMPSHSNKQHIFLFLFANSQVSCFLEFSDSKEGNLPRLSLSQQDTQDSRREGAPLKQVSRSPNCSPAHKNYQRPTEQPTDSSSPANSPRHALKPPNGFLAQKKREQDRDRDMDGITQDTFSVVKVDKQGLLNGDAGDVAKREIMDEGLCRSTSRSHRTGRRGGEEETPEQCEVVMDSIPEQKVTWFCVREDWWGVILSVRVSVSVFMESVVTLSHSYLTPRARLRNVLSHLPDLHADVHIRACFFTFSLTGRALISICREQMD